MKLLFVVIAVCIVGALEAKFCTDRHQCHCHLLGHSYDGLCENNECVCPTGKRASVHHHVTCATSDNCTEYEQEHCAPQGHTAKCNHGHCHCTPH